MEELAYHLDQQLHDSTPTVSLRAVGQNESQTVAEFSYTTRERIMRAPDIKASAYATADVDAAIVTASGMVDDLCHRGRRSRGIPGFYPWIGTLTFNYPNQQNAGTFRLWLDQFRIISLTSLTSGGTDITATALLEPAASGPPYNRIDLDQATSQGFTFTSGIGQRSIAVRGVFGENDVQQQRATLTTGINASATTITVSGRLDVGMVIVVDTERMQVLEKSWTTSSQTGTLTAAANAQTLAVSDGTVFAVGEELLLDAERVMVQDIAGNNLIVRRASGGSTLAAHTAATIFWPRSITVTRGVLGTTAATHSIGAAVMQQLVPSSIEELTRAYAMDTFFQGGSGYARTVGAGEGERNYSGRAIRELEERVYGAYGRRIRSRAV